MEGAVRLLNKICQLIHLYEQESSRIQSAVAMEVNLDKKVSSKMRFPEWHRIYGWWSHMLS